MLNRRNAKREASGEDKKEKSEKQDMDEQVTKTEGEDSDKEQQSAELDKEKDEQEEMEYSEEPESMTPIAINIQNSFSGGRRIIDPLMQRLEGIAECGSSPHATIDESTMPAPPQDTAEKVWVVAIS